jgi:hypothetical protein
MPRRSCAIYRELGLQLRNKSPKQSGASMAAGREISKGGGT